jgi:hypothetical protein
VILEEILTIGLILGAGAILVAFVAFVKLKFQSKIEQEIESNKAGASAPAFFSFA